MVKWTDYLIDKDHENSKLVKFNFSIPELDSLVEGFTTGELITVSGHTGQGKTTFTKTLAKQFGLANYPTLVFSFEDPPTRYLEPFKELEGCESIYLPKELKTGSLDWIENKVIEAKTKFNCQVVIIDHLHYIVDMNLNRNFSLNIGAAMRFLKSKIAIGLNQTVFIVCHQEKVECGQEPSLETIRDSSFIGQESDMVLVVSRTPDETHLTSITGKRTPIPKNEQTFDKGLATVKIEKARRTGVFRKSMIFQKVGMWLEGL